MDKDIVIRGLNVSFAGKQGISRVVRDVNVTFPAGSVTGLIGESGSGKSVLGMSILGLLPSTTHVTGTCEYNGRDLYRLSEKELCGLRGREIALIPQNPSESLDPIRRIGGQLTESILVHGTADRKQAEARRDETLHMLGFDEPKHISRAYTFQLSGGMNQRVISAMGLMNRPDWIIADEPTKGLDAILRRQVYGVLKNISSEGSRGMIVITHDVALAGALCGRIAVLYKGMILEQGETKALLGNPLHPYTRGLIASLPSRGMHPIRRADPARESMMDGCPFYPRCDHAKDECAKAFPPECAPESDRIVRCFLYA